MKRPGARTGAGGGSAGVIADALGGSREPSRGFAASCRSFEAESQANDDRKRQTSAVVVDVVEVGPSERVDLSHAADVPQPQLDVDIHLLCDREQHACPDAPGEGGGAVIEIRIVDDEVRLRSGQVKVDPVDESHAKRPLAVEPNVRPRE